MSDEKKRLSIEQIQDTPEYQRLTQKQQLFVATYCAGGLLDGKYDAVAATRTAYQCKSAEVARIMSYSLLQNIRIIEVLNRHFGVTPIEEFLVQVNRAINNRNLTQAQMDALKLKSDILGYANRIPNHQSVGAIPSDVLEESRKARKPKKPVIDETPYVQPPGPRVKF